jgi:SepF-like predicted cell division protein (DUF552 family)
MGSVLDILIGDADTLDDKEYESLDHSKTTLNPESSFTLSVGEVHTKSDLLKVEEAILSGQIIIIKVTNLGTGLTKDDVVNFLNEAVQESQGDISWRSNQKEELIVTPNGVDINREKIL